MQQTSSEMAFGLLPPDAWAGEVLASVHLDPDAPAIPREAMTSAMIDAVLADAEACRAQLDREIAGLRARRDALANAALPLGVAA